MTIFSPGLGVELDIVKVWQRPCGVFLLGENGLPSSGLSLPTIANASRGVVSTANPAKHRQYRPHVRGDAQPAAPDSSAWIRGHGSKSQGSRYGLLAFARCSPSHRLGRL